MATAFSLKEWRKRKNKPLVTFAGEPAKVVFTKGMGERPVLIVIWDGNTTDSEWLTADGRDERGKQILYFKETFARDIKDIPDSIFKSLYKLRTFGDISYENFVSLYKIVVIDGTLYCTDGEYEQGVAKLYIKLMEDSSHRACTFPYAIITDGYVVKNRYGSNGHLNIEKDET